MARPGDPGPIHAMRQAVLFTVAVALLWAVIVRMRRLSTCAACATAALPGWRLCGRCLAEHRWTRV